MVSIQKGLLLLMELPEMGASLVMQFHRLKK
jgi:hypothetical protein